MHTNNQVPREFDWEYYLDQYPDLRQAGLSTPDECKSHWIQYGKKEGRRCCTPVDANNSSTEKIPFVVVVCGHNISRWVELCLDSIYEQTYSRYRIVFVDDASTDHTRELVRKWREGHADAKFTYLHNAIRVYPAISRHKGVHICHQNEVCVFLDGDDWLVDTHVLQVVHDTYVEKRCLMTLGSFTYAHPRQDPQWRHSESRWQLDRRSRWHSRADIEEAFFPHLRTVHASVCKRVPISYIQDHEGNGARVGTDVCLFLACCELVGPHALAFIDTPLVVYNMCNSMYQNTGYHNRTNGQNFHNEYKSKLFAHQGALDPLSVIPHMDITRLVTPYAAVYDGPHIYWLNMPTSTQRRINMEQMLQKFGVDNNGHTRIDATMGESDTTKGPNSPGEVGLVQTTCRALRIFLESNQEWCIIAEDDMSLELMPYWPKGGAWSVVHNAPNDAECLQLQCTAYASTFSDIFVNATTLYLAQHPRVYGAAMYALSRAGAERFMGHLNINPSLVYQKPIDHSMYRIVKTYMYRYPLAVERDTDADTTIRDRKIGTLSSIKERHMNARMQVIIWVKSQYQLRQISTEW